MTYQQFYADCNRFIDDCDAHAAEFPGDKEYCERMRNSVLDVLVFAQDRERRGWA